MRETWTYRVFGIPVLQVRCEREFDGPPVGLAGLLPPTASESSQPVSPAEREQIPVAAQPARRGRQPRPRAKQAPHRSRRTLTEAEREQIVALAREGQSQADIARLLGRWPSSVSRHIPADVRAAQHSRPPKPRLHEDAS